MVIRRYMLVLVWLALSACEGDTLSIGELRCVGKTIRCVAPEVEFVQTRDAHPQPTAAGTSELAWSRSLPQECDHPPCLVLRGDMVVHPDASITVVRMLSWGIWLARFDSGGDMRWANEDLIDTKRKGLNYVDLSYPALLLDGDGSTLLATASLVHGEGQLTLYRVTDDGKLERVFRAPGPAGVSAIALMQDDVAVLGQYWDGDPFSQYGPNPELARYRRDGTLVWRQAALQPSFDTTSPNAWFTMQFDMPLLVDPEARAWLVVLHLLSDDITQADLNLMQIGADGNVNWAQASIITRSRTSANFRAVLSMDDMGHGVFAQDSAGYRLDQLVDHGSEPAEMSLSVYRDREEYWEPYLLGLDRDPTGRMLVATQTGVRSSPRFHIDRYDEAAEQPHTFVFEGAGEMVASGAVEDDGFAGVQQIRAASNTEVYVLSSSRVSKLVLTED